MIKTGVDNPGHPHIKTVGMTAGDEESYQVFKALFDPVISARHGGYAADAVQPTNLDISQLSDTDIDPEGKYVLTTRVRTGRSVRGFKLPPVISFEERRQLEALLVKALRNMGGDLKGDYFPLHGSRSYGEKAGGMSLEKEESLRRCGNLFQEPDSTLLLASGMGRHWPDGRGVFHNDDTNLFVWVGEEDHLRIVSMQGSREEPSAVGKDIKEVVARFIRACDEVQKVLKEAGCDFMHNDHLGWVLTCPSNLGTGLRAGTMVRLPKLSSRGDWKALCGCLRLQARGTGGVDSAATGGTWDISNADRIGKGEVELVNTLIEGAAQLVRWESALDAGRDAEVEAEIQALMGGGESKGQEGGGDYPPTGLSPGVQTLPGWIQLGCGDAAYNCAEKGATFAPDGVCPDEMPDLSQHSSFMADVLNAQPGLWAELKDKRTSNGVTLAQVIKTGVDNPGHPHIKTVGMTAGDEESYQVFKPLFDPVISARHGGYAADAVQPTNLDISQLSDTDIDPEGKYVLTTRVRTGRSVRGFKLPPCISFEERRRLEALCVKALLRMEGDLKGDYFPLHGSRSYGEKAGGMSLEKEESLRRCGNLFQEPDSTLLLASGMGRHWPDGRGVFHNHDTNLFVWVGEEDHLRIVSMQGSREEPSAVGKDIKEVVARFIRACDEVQKVLKEAGCDFMHNDHLGWVLTCPSNLGTGLRAGTMVRLPKLSSRGDWKALCGCLRLQARGTGGVDSAATGGTWDISNADRIGKGEVELVNTLIEGAAQLVRWESALDAGRDAEVEAADSGPDGGWRVQRARGWWGLPPHRPVPRCAVAAWLDPAGVR